MCTYNECIIELVVGLSQVFDKVMTMIIVVQLSYDVIQVFNDVIVFSNSHLLMSQHNKLIFSVTHQIERYVCTLCVWVGDSMVQSFCKSFKTGFNFHKILADV